LNVLIQSHTFDFVFPALYWNWFYCSNLAYTE